MSNSYVFDYYAHVENRLPGGDSNSGDNVFGTDLNDFVNGRDGIDYHEGGLGNDLYIVSESADVIFEQANSGIDTVESWAMSYSLPDEVENLFILRSNGDATGNSGDNIIFGNDTGNRISGGDGDDYLIGLRGADILEGGLGSDVFVLTSLGDSGDRITDFEVGVDHLDLNPLFDSLGEGFVAQAAVSDQVPGFSYGGSIAPGTLKYDRPDFSDYRVIDLNDYHGTTNFRFGDNENVLFLGADEVRTTSWLKVTGGNDIAILGGKFQPQSDGWAKTGAIVFRETQGSVYIEGVHIDNKNSFGSDGIVLNGPGGDFIDVTIQNVRVDNVGGTQRGKHGDVIQPQGPVEAMKIYNLTGATSYQGFFLDYQEKSYGGKLKHIELENVDLRHIDGSFSGSQYLLWFDNDGSKQTVELNNVWVTQQDGGRAPEQHAVWPKTGRDGDVISWSQGHIQGSVNVGRPSPDGFVPADSVGIGYSLAPPEPAETSDTPAEENSIPEGNLLFVQTGDDTAVYIDAEGNDRWQKLVTLENTNAEQALAAWEATDFEALAQEFNDRVPGASGNSADQSAEEPPVEDPAVEEPTPEDPPVSDPAVEEPAAEEPAPEDPPAEDPPAEDPPAEDPAPEEPASDDPVADDPAVEEPTSDNGGSGDGSPVDTDVQMRDPIDIPSIDSSSSNYIRGGNGFDDLSGTSANDFINGRGSADRMSGGEGDDTYVVNNINDEIIERVGEGIDRVQSWANSYTLSDNVENLELEGSSGAEGNGNALNNIIVGGSGDDTLRGEAGEDVLIGGTGVDEMFGGADHDVFVIRTFDEGGDIIRDFEAGTDTLDLRGVGQAGETLVFRQDGTNTVVELDGNTVAVLRNTEASSLVDGRDVWSGDASVTIPDGTPAPDGDDLADEPAAGEPADEQPIDGQPVDEDPAVEEPADDQPADEDPVAEEPVADEPAADEPTSDDDADVDRSGDLKEQIDISFLQSASIDNWMRGQSGQDDNIIGTNNNDYINGRSGSDNMFGGEGDDTYVVNQVDDHAIENAGGGVDMVLSYSSSFTLGEHMENLLVRRSSGSDARGNDLDNQIDGAEGNDSIRGYEGDDILIGRGGSDWLSGGDGDDIFVFTDLSDAGDQGDTVSDFTIGDDVLDLRGIANQVGAENIEFVQDGQDTKVVANGTELATLQGVSKDDLEQDYDYWV